MAKPIIIHATELYDGTSKLADRTVEIQNGKITDVSKGKPKRADVKGIVTPAFIDPHSHIGMIRAGEPGGESEGNEVLHPIMPLSDPIKSVYFDDEAFSDAIDFGVLYSCIMPGSGNIFGGRSRIIKNFARHKGEALLRDYGYKMALGFNPRSTQGWRGERPTTRMGLYSMLERRFDEVLTKEKKTILAREKKERELAKKKDLSKKDRALETSAIQQEFDFEFTLEEKALLDVLYGKKPVKVHVHKEDDVIYLIELVERYGLNVSAEHTSDVFNLDIFKLLEENKIPVIYGPLGSHPYKVELKHSNDRANAKLLMDSGAEFGLMTDHPVIHAVNLRDSLKYFLMNGMSDADAIGLISKQNAKLLKIDDILGAVAPGKTASVLVWDKDPLHLAAMPKLVIAEGEILRGRLG